MGMLKDKNIVDFIIEIAIYVFDKIEYNVFVIV